MKRQLSGFTSQAGRAAFLAAYDHVLAELWPVPYESVELPTRFGSTHAIVSGPPTAPPLLLLHGAGLSATSWYPNIATYAERFRTYALDTIFDSGRSRQIHLLQSRQDCAAWIGDVLDALGVDQTAILGLSQGGWAAACAARFLPDRVTRLGLLARWAPWPGSSCPTGLPSGSPTCCLAIFGRWVLHICVKFHAAWGRRARAA